MKRVIVCFLFLNIFISGVSGNAFKEIDNEGVVFLDVADSKEEKPIVKKGSVKVEDIKIKKENNVASSDYNPLLFEDVDRKKPQDREISKSIEKKVLNDTTVGVKYSASQKNSAISDSIDIYSKYEKGHFGLTTSYSQDRSGYKENGIQGGTLSVAPEFKINNRLKLKNVFSDNPTTNQQKREFVLSIQPFKDDRMDLDLGAGESFSGSGQGAKSQINIGTTFRF